MLYYRSYNNNYYSFSLFDYLFVAVSKIQNLASITLKLKQYIFLIYFYT